MKKLLTIIAVMFCLVCNAQKVDKTGDTLEITSPKIKFIKVDGKVYEIVRTTELKEAVKKQVSIISDTMHISYGMGYHYFNGQGVPNLYIDSTKMNKRAWLNATPVINTY